MKYGRWALSDVQHFTILRRLARLPAMVAVDQIRPATAGGAGRIQ